MRIHSKPISCADCHATYGRPDGETALGEATGVVDVYVGDDTGWVYFGDPIEHDDDKHLCPNCAAERYPILTESINAATRAAQNIPITSFHPPSISTKLAIDFALAVSGATIAERQEVGPDFGVRNFSPDPNDSAKLILTFGDKSALMSVEAVIADIERLRWEPAAKLLRSAIAQRPPKRSQGA
jgi:hypothetical protein